MPSSPSRARPRLSLRRDGTGSPATLILAGVAVAAFFTAMQTYLQQRNSDTLRQVYAWILGRLSTTGWDEVTMLLPYAVVCGAVLVYAVGGLDVLAVGDEEARSLGLHPARVRAAVLVAASLATAAAVAVSGLIGFVGLIVPHGVRMVAGASTAGSCLCRCSSAQPSSPSPTSQPGPSRRRPNCRSA